jgi:hypothetical protein
MLCELEKYEKQHFRKEGSPSYYCISDRDLAGEFSNIRVLTTVRVGV